MVGEIKLAKNDDVFHHQERKEMVPGFEFKEMVLESYNESSHIPTEQ